jgi:hypothetical protein
MLMIIDFDVNILDDLGGEPPDRPTDELDGACVPFEIYWLRAADQELFAPAEQSAFNIHNAHEHNSSCL